jgi:integrase
MVWSAFGHSYRRELPLTITTLREHTRRILRRAGVRNFRLFDLRHTYASILLAECSTDHVRRAPAWASFARYHAPVLALVGFLNMAEASPIYWTG